jgi:hypothetical protein
MTADIVKMGYTVPLYIPIKITVEPDPLGTVNSIVRIARRADDKLLRGILVPVGKTPKIGLGPRSGVFSNSLWASFQTVWFVEVDGRRIFEISEWDRAMRVPYPKPHIPWRRRARWKIRRAHIAVAGRLGYVLASECRCGDDDD